MEHKNIFLGSVTFVSVLLYELSAFFMENGFAWMNIVKNIFYVILLCCMMAQKVRNTIPFHVKLYAVLVAFLIFLQFSTDISSSFLNLLLNTFFFFLFIRYCSDNFVKYYIRSIVIITFISSIPLVWFYMTIGYYARDLIIFDKSYQTFLFGFSSVYLFYCMINGNQKNIALIVCSLVYLLFCNIFILQSKTSIFAFVVVIAFWSILHPAKFRLIILKYSKYIIIMILALAFTSTSIEIPNGIKHAANKLLGNDVLEVDVVMNDETYEVREQVRNKMWKVIDQYPITGAGIGNIEKTLKSTGTGLNQGESQFVDFALEGGYTFIFAFLVLAIPIITSSIKNSRINEDLPHCSLVSMSMISFMVLCVGNEMISIITYMYLATMIYLVHRQEKVIV